MNSIGQTELKSPKELEEIIDSLLVQKKVDTAEISRLKEENNLLRAALYGRKSEKIVDEPLEPSLFDLLDEATSENQPADNSGDEEAVEVKSHTRKKRGRKPIPEHFPRVDRIHDLDESEKLCGCGVMKTCIGKEVSEQLDIIPAKIQVIRNIRLKYACEVCEGVEDDGPTVSIARMPDQLIPKCIGTPGLIAYVLIAKFADALPFYRQEKQFLRMGVEIPRATMCNWAKQIAISIEILLHLLINEIHSGPLIQADETPVQVLGEPNRSNHTKSYMWVFRGGTRGSPVVLFEYHPSRGGKVAAAFLDGYEGVVQTDGYSAYDFLDPKKKIKHMACWAHVRRKFFKVSQAAGKAKDGKSKTGFADEALKLIKELYDIEQQTMDDGLTGEALLRERQEKAESLLDDFKKDLIAKVEKVPPKSLLGQAINYTLNQWDRLLVWLESPHVTLDNNLAENAIRPFAVGRKNWLFSGSPDGAAASAAIYTLIETAKANKLEPYWYLRYLFEKLPEAMTEDEFKALLPQYIDPSQLDGPKIS